MTFDWFLFLQCGDQIFCSLFDALLILVYQNQGSHRLLLLWGLTFSHVTNSKHVHFFFCSFADDIILFSSEGKCLLVGSRIFSSYPYVSVINTDCYAASYTANFINYNGINTSGKFAENLIFLPSWHVWHYAVPVFPKIFSTSNPFENKHFVNAPHLLNKVSNIILNLSFIDNTMNKMLKKHLFYLL